MDGQQPHQEQTSILHKYPLQKTKAVYIMGLGHSGSTFLQLLLAAHSHMAGLGEIALLIKHLKAGNTADVLDKISKNKELSNFWHGIEHFSEQSSQAIFEEVIARFQRVHPDQIWIDSSKTLEGFQKYYRNQKERFLTGKEVKVVYLVRDFRSWILSSQKVHIRKNRKDWGLLFNSYRWLYVNLKWLLFLKTHKISYHRVMYEGLVFQHESTVRALLNYIEVPQETLDLANAINYDVYGNRMKDDKSKRSKIVYDHSWFGNLNTILLAPVLLPQFILNAYFYRKSRH
jgi:hypothetical protein